MGLSSGLGGAITACAAARAGVTRPVQLSFAVEDREALEMVPVSGLSVGDLTLGFSEVGLAVRLASLALADLLSRTPLTSEELRQTAVVLNLGSPFYLERAEEWEKRAGASSSPASGPSRKERFESAKPLYRAVIDKSFDAIGLASPPAAHQYLVFGDQAGVGVALEAAHGLLAEGQVTACLVGGVDSLAEPRWLEACNLLGVLKTAVRPIGMLPGEAGAFVLLEARAKRARSRPPLGHVIACESGRETGDRFADSMPVGRVASETIRRCVESTPLRGAFGLISDINGDPSRAMDFGHALGRLAPRVVPASIVTPALSFGDTRAASGFLGLCMALRAFARNYAPGPTYVISAMSDDGGRAALRVDAATPS